MDKKKRIGSYIVSFDTFLLQPVVKGNKISTHVIERNGELNVPRKPIHIVRKSCDYYGGSLQNSTNTAKLAIGKRHKTPIIIAHDFGVPYIFLPTMSPNSEQNVWVSYSAIDNIEPDDMGCILYFGKWSFLQGQYFGYNNVSPICSRYSSRKKLFEKAKTVEQTISQVRRFPDED